MQFTIKARFSLTPLITVEIEADGRTSERVKLGRAILKAVAGHANLRGANLRGAYLRGANLRGAYLRGAYLKSANLSGANLSGANLSGANLSDANLSDANLSGANLSGANLSDAYLSDAYLSGANLSDAYLSGANLRGANLRGANLSDAYLSGANLSGASSKIKKLVARVTRDDGYEFFGFILEDDTRWIAAGCQSRSLAGYRDHVTEYNAPAKEAETNAILDYIEKRAEAHTCAAG